MLRNRAEGEGEECPCHCPPTGGVLGEELQLASTRRVLDHRRKAAGPVADQHRDQCEADDDDDGLQQVGERHRPHAAEDRVDHDDGSAEHDCVVEFERTARQHMDHEPECRHLCGCPAQIGQRDCGAGEHLGRLAVALAIEVPDRQQVHPVEEPREQQRREHEAHRGAERVAGHAVQALGRKLGRDGQHGLGAKPRGEHRRHVHVERQRTAGDEVVPRTLHPARGQEPDGYGDGEVEQYEGDQHVDWIRSRKSAGV